MAKPKLQIVKELKPCTPYDLYTLGRECVDAVAIEAHSVQLLRAEAPWRQDITHFLGEESCFDPDWEGRDNLIAHERQLVHELSHLANALRREGAVLFFRASQAVGARPDRREEAVSVIAAFDGLAALVGESLADVKPGILSIAPQNAAINSILARGAMLVGLLREVAGEMNGHQGWATRDDEQPKIRRGGAGGGEKDEFTVMLTGAGDRKIQVIKVVCEITGLGPKEAKDLVNGAPKAVKEGLSKAEAEELKKKLVEAGATVSIR